MNKYISKQAGGQCSSRNKSYHLKETEQSYSSQKQPLTPEEAWNLEEPNDLIPTQAVPMLQLETH